MAPLAKLRQKEIFLKPLIAHYVELLYKAILLPRALDVIERRVVMGLQVPSFVAYVALQLVHSHSYSS